MNAIVAHNGHDFRSSTDAAGLCGPIVKQTAKNIQGRRYVSVEGWQAIAIAHGCAASALEVERVNDEGMSGFKCVGVVRRMDDGAEIARGEGFLGDDENTWNKRPVYARRAMVQTRAISRACRSAFAHVVVMIDAGLSTTPAEEVPEGGFIEGQYQEVARDEPRPAQKPKLDPAAKINDKTRHALQDLIIKSGGDVSQFCRDNGLTSLADLTNARSAELAAPLKAKLAAAPTPFGEILADEVPY